MTEFKYLKNASYAFYKEYLEYAYTGGYSNLNKDFLRIVNGENNETVTIGKRQCECLRKLEDQQADNASGAIVFQETFEVIYPGALIGSGYPHITGKMDGEYQNGFCFDHITGSPYYPGSSIKGVIADSFARALMGRIPEKKGYFDYLTYVIKKAVKKDLTRQNIECIWKQSFQGILPGESVIHESMFERDIFYDAYITAVNQNTYNWCKDLIGDDVITPHPSPVKEPKPITVLRLMPGVRLTFTMLLHEVRDGSNEIILTAEEKNRVFCEIIMDMGIGSRTNLGYGVLERV